MCNSYLCRFIEKNPDNWDVLLSSAPYFLKIKKDGDLAIFNYNIIASDVVEVDGEEKELRCDFSLPEVQEARGIILNCKELKVVCWPFRKFGNYGESYVDDIDWESARVQQKVDGSIIKLWFNKITDNWQVSTNGLIDAREAFIDGKTVSFYELFEKARNNQHLEYDKLDKNMTYIFELVSPFNRVVIKYPEERIYHIGTRSNISGEEFDVDIGVIKPKGYQIHTLDDCIEAAKNLNLDCDVTNLAAEGFVVVDKNWHRIKIKSPEYVLVHHALNGGNISQKQMVELILVGEQDEYLTYYPEYSDAFKNLERKIDYLKTEIFDTRKKMLKLWNDANFDRKLFALCIKNEKRKGWAFNFIDGKTCEEVFSEIRLSALMQELERIKL